MNVSSGRWLVLHDFIVVTYLTCHILIVFANHLLYAFNVVCRTPCKNTCPRGRATAPLVHERFTRYKAEAVAARNERDKAHAREAEARELLRIAKRKAEKTKLALQTAEDKVYKYRLALFFSWTMVDIYFVFFTAFGGYGHTRLCLP